MKPRSELQRRKIADAAWDSRWTNRLKEKREVAATVSSDAIGNDLMARYGEYAVRKPSDFNRSLKTRDEGKIRLAWALHLFGKYQAPRHLQAAWYLDVPAAGQQPRLRVNVNGNERITTAHIAIYRNWFLCVSTGGSLYKEHTKSLLTKKETHAFLTCPLNVTFDEAILYAMASSHTDDLGIRTRILKSKLIGHRFVNPPNAVALAARNIDRQNEFWKDAVRFFCVNPVPINQMNDLIDYLTHMFNQNNTYDLKGRTLESLEAHMRQWHRDLGRVKRMGNRTWEGVPLADVTYTGEGPDKLDWSFTQIISSKLLADEGNKMHHCVYSYQHHCLSGRVSIWSVKVRKNKGDFERAITLEINNDTAAIVQIRGYANRMARHEELAIIQKWASENNLRITNRGW